MHSGCVLLWLQFGVGSVWYRMGSFGILLHMWHWLQCVYVFSDLEKYKIKAMNWLLRLLLIRLHVLSLHSVKEYSVVHILTASPLGVSMINLPLCTQMNWLFTVVLIMQKNTKRPLNLKVKNHVLRPLIKCLDVQMVPIYSLSQGLKRTFHRPPPFHIICLQEVPLAKRLTA